MSGRKDTILNIEKFIKIHILNQNVGNCNQNKCQKTDKYSSECNFESNSNEEYFDELIENLLLPGFISNSVIYQLDALKNV